VLKDARLLLAEKRKKKEVRTEVKCGVLVGQQLRGEFVDPFRLS